MEDSERSHDASAAAAPEAGNPTPSAKDRKAAAKAKVRELQGDLVAAMPVVKDRAEHAGGILRDLFRKIFPQRWDHPETRYFKLFGMSLFGLLLLAGLVGFATFLLTLRSPEAVAVPRVTGMELAEAIDALQEFGLVVNLEQKTFPDPGSKGKIMEQNPAPATPVRVGREVTIVLSKGASVDKVANYVGRNIEAVKEEVRSMFGEEKPLVAIGEIVYVFDPAEAGTVISQEPSPGADLTRAVTVDLLVSRGKDASLKDAPALLGLPWDKAVAELVASDIPFKAELGVVGPEAAPGTVLGQEPGAGQQVKPGDFVKITVIPPADLGEGKAFGIYRASLPAYAVPVEVTLSVVSPSGTTRQAVRCNHPGGELAVPYLADIGSELVLMVFGKEFDRQVVRQE